jgi:hypothetical protein
MKRIEIIASDSAYTNLSTFETIEELNETVRSYKHDMADELNKTELAVLDLLHRYSAKYKGVSFLCKNRIAELIGKSRRTIIRVCNRLEALGVIRQLPMKRASDMQQTSNAIVIQPVKTDDVVLNVPHGINSSMSTNVTQEVSENVTPIKQNISLKQKPYLHNTYPSGPVPATPYAMFKQFVNNFVNDPKLTNKLYGIYLAQTYYIRDVYDSGELFNIGLQAIKETFQASKRKRLRNITGYYHGTICRMYDRYQHEERVASYYGG